MPPSNPAPQDPAPQEPAPPNPAREDLLDRVIGYAATHGLADQSLREIAEGVGSSHRMLLYHFGSREGLVAAIVTRVEADQRVLLADLAARHTDPAALIRAQWALLTDPSTLPYVRLFYELAGLAVHA
ncbi:MAG: TetR/AcrR family transcriptional regulator, partial [Nocardioides sp.]